MDGQERLRSEAAEQAVLGSIMLDPDALGVVQEAGLMGGHFATSSHRALFEGMETLGEAGSPLDPITLAEVLGSRGKLDLVGGMGYLVELSTNTPSAANVESYARIVLERAQQRHWFAVLNQARDGFLDPHCGDPVAQAEAILAQLEARPGLAGFIALRDALPTEIERLEYRFKNPGADDGLRTGYHNIDHRLGNLQPGDLVIVGARPAMGKTAYALNVVRQVALQRKAGSVLVYSLEMITGSLVQRLLAAQGKVKKDLLRSAKVFDHGESHGRLVTAAQVLSTVDIRICDQPGLTVRQVRSMALAEKRRHGVRLVVVDYLGLLEHEGRERSTADQIGDITRTLKRLARELGCPVVILAQLNREVDKRPNKRPVLSDLRDSGAIEQDADVVQFLYRDDYYNPDNSQWPGQVEVITAKCREGEIGSDYLKWQGQYQLMESQSTYDQSTPTGVDDWY